MKKRGTSAKGPSQRQLRVGERIRHILSDTLRDIEFRDPDLKNPSLITVTAVEIGPDLKHAHVFVMPLGGENMEETIAALNRAASFLRGAIGKHIETRHTPKLSFHKDDSFENASHIENLLKEAGMDRYADDIGEEEPEEEI